MLNFDAQIPREINAETGLPIGPTVANATPAPRPERVVLDGQYCRLEPLDPIKHGDDLFKAATPPDAAARHLYLFEFAPTSRADYQIWLQEKAASNDPLFFAVIDKATGRAVGRQTLMRIDPANRCIEIGSIYWGPDMARTRLSTEAQYLFTKYAFDLGYTRYEWKCHALNAPSREAALRFGFTYEGHFRRAVVIKDRIRDTTWYSIISDEWPRLKAAYDTWLSPSNFDAKGQQKQRLSDLTRAALAAN